MKKRLWKITMLRFWVTCLASGSFSVATKLQNLLCIFNFFTNICLVDKNSNFSCFMGKIWEAWSFFYHLLGKPLSNFPWGRSHYNLQWCAWQRSIRLLCSEQFYEISTNHSSSWAAIMCKHHEEAICIPSLYSESLTKTCVTGLK